MHAIHRLVFRASASAALTSALLAGAAFAQAPGPFAAPSTLPFQAPPFDKIQDSDYAPGFDAAIAENRAEIDTIANDAAAPTFDNTIAAMERAGLMLDRVQAAFNAVVQANTDDALEKVQADVNPRLAALNDDIYLNPRLFARVHAVYQARASLTPEQQQLATIYEQDFEHAGANLSDADKAKLRDLNQKISTLETAFQQKLLAATKAGALLVSDKAKLAGFSADEIAGAAAAAQSRGLKDQYAVLLQNTTQQPALQDLSDRAVREELFQNSWTRTEKGDANDVRDTIATLAQLRAVKAQLLGYPNFAAYKLYNQMAKTPETVEAFMAQMIPATAAKAADEAKANQAMIDKSGEHFALKPWDWERYAEQVRKAQYDYDENAVKPYFELNNVRDNGLFYAANVLYGVTFKERHDIPVWQPDVRVFEVFDKDGSELGLVYFDYFKRDNKAGGAWMNTFVAQSKLLGTKPVVYNVANFVKPAPGQPALLTFDDVTTMFHEFGHGLHALFSNVTYPDLAGTHVARDFVEFPSQFNEHWALYPDVLRHYAVDYKTGKPMPEALIAKIRKAATFDQGYAFGEILAAAELDMQWHKLPASAPKEDVDAFETKALAATHTDFADVPPRYRSSYFLHIWSNGYSAAYYAYIWTEMLDDDAYSWFVQHGGLKRENGQRFRDMILSKGHTEDYAPMFRAFYGKDPDVGPLLEHRGLVPAKD